MRSLSIDHLATACFVALSCLLLALSIFHDFAFDEAWSYLEGVPASFWGVVSYEEFFLANNHLLNTLQMRVVAFFGFTDPFPYRIASLGSYIGAFLVLRHIVSRQGNGSALAAVAVLAMPWSIYFAQARGYAPAIFFLIILIGIFLRLRERFTISLFFVYSLAATFCILSLFSFLFPVAAFTILLIPTAVRFVSNAPVSKIVLAALVSMPAALTVVYVYFAGQIVSEKDLLIVGTDQLLQGGMLSSAVSYMASQGSFDDGLGFQLARAAILVSIFAFVFHCFRQRRIPPELLAVALTITLLIISHLLLGSLYPKSRAVLFVPLIVYLGAARNVPVKHWVSWCVIFLPPIITGALTMSLVFQKIHQPTSVDLIQYVESHTNCASLYRDKGHRNLNLANAQFGTGKVEIVEHTPWAMKPEGPFDVAAEAYNCIVVYDSKSLTTRLSASFEPEFKSQYGTLLVRKSE